MASEDHRPDVVNLGGDPPALCQTCHGDRPSAYLNSMIGMGIVSRLG